MTRTADGQCHRWRGPEDAPVRLDCPLPLAARDGDDGRPLPAIAVTPGDVFAVRPGDDPAAVRVCVCAEPDEGRLERALNVLARLVEADRSAALPVV